MNHELSASRQMKTPSKLIHFMWLVVVLIMFGATLPIVAAFSTAPISFGCDGRVQASIAYDRTSLLVFDYDSAPVSLADDMLNGRIGTSGTFAKSAGFLAAEGIANPIPSTLARVIPGEGPFPTLGLPGSADVFVTDAAAIRGMTPAQIAPRLGIPASDAFSVVEFPSAGQSLASPVFRSNPGFIGRGLTSGQAPEFVIPNGPIPPGATTTIIRSR